MGNEFLSHINEVDGLIQLVRCFDDDEVSHFEGSVDPTRDLDIIKTELILKDLSRARNEFEKLNKKNRVTKDQDQVLELMVLERAIKLLEEGIKIIDHPEWTADDIHHLNKHLFLTSKPSMYVANVDNES